MLEIKPFKAVLYNQEKAGELSKIVCPPYDVIDKKERENYANLSPYNMVRLILPSLEEAQVLGCDNIYSCARKTLESWLKEGILHREASEAIYLYEQEYVFLGEKKVRRGIVSLLKLEDVSGSDNAGVNIHAHEHTRLEPLEDRLALIRQVRANLSPIFALFADKNHLIKRIRDKYSAAPCEISVKIGSESHRLWRVSDAKLVNEARRDLKSSDVFIADGHHRYEVACNYRLEARKALGNPDKELDCDYLMVYFTGLRSRGLTIMPTHRLINGVASELIGRLDSELNKYFDIHKARDKSELFIMLGKAVKSEYVIGMYKEKKFYLLRLKSGIKPDKIIAIDKSETYKQLCVVILDYLILEKMLDLKSERSCREQAGGAKCISYTNDADMALKLVNNKEAQLVFFLNPVKVEEMASLALKGERMPPKSTFFYPKLLTGLLINKFSDGSGLA